MQGYKDKQIQCEAKNCTHWQSDYNKQTPKVGYCGGAGCMVITEKGKCANFCDNRTLEMDITKAVKILNKYKHRGAKWTEGYRTEAGYEGIAVAVANGMSADMYYISEEDAIKQAHKYIEINR